MIQTLDGIGVEIQANIMGISGEEEDAIAKGAEGIGLLRTEFLFAAFKKEPTEHQQFVTYEKIFSKIGNRPIIARTFDIGGDKPVAWLDIPKEPNPFLGWRGVRIGLSRPKILKTQIRALRRAGVGHELEIMFPMISNAEELGAATGLLWESMSELSLEEIEYNDKTTVGIMIETPSAAIMADELAKEVDFISIGSNDLTQYTLAVDRGNAKVSHLFNHMHPAVMRLISYVIEAAHKQGIWVGLCGELASDMKAIPILVGLGLDELSMRASAIPDAISLIQGLDTSKLDDVVEKALEG
jgi:phosphoenolpyruvate-protein phosphotransferase